MLRKICHESFIPFFMCMPRIASEKNNKMECDVQLSHAAKCRIQHQDFRQQLQSAAPDQIFSATEEANAFVLTFENTTTEDVKNFLDEKNIPYKDAEFNHLKHMNWVMYFPEAIRADHLAQVLEHPKLHSLSDGRERDVALGS